VGLKRCLERRLGDAAGVVGDGRCGDDRNDLEGEILAETGRDEAIDILVPDSTARLDHPCCKSR
jgi:hypothetical protein